jgi:hypothetical protein
VPFAAFISYSAAYSKIMLPHETPRTLTRVLQGSAAMLLFSIYAAFWKAKGSIKYRTIML